jgi:hypothetical protein
MTPGQKAYEAYQQALGTDATPAEMREWDELLSSEQFVWDQVAEALLS